MTTPDSHELQVVRGSLRKVADIWDQQGNAIGAIASKAAGMRLDRLDAGVFQLIVTPYDQVVDQVAARCHEGRQRMHDIAGALRRSASTYGTAEHDISNEVHTVH